MITAEPAARVRAILEPLRELAEEIVIGVDSRVDLEAVGGYVTVSDAAYRIEYRRSERHLGWLHAQCQSDWILMLDGDEVLSAALLDRLPGLIESRSVEQYWIPRLWLWPDSEHALDEPPWSTDFNNRLVRNDGTLRFPGDRHRHASPVSPHAYIEEPIYHLDLLLNSRQAREAKAARYEAECPGLVAHGGGSLNEAFYLPERRPGAGQRGIPAEDRARIERVLRADDRPARFETAVEVPFVPLGELDRFWEGRALAESTYAARIEPFESSYRMAPSEVRSLFFWVSNEGSEFWPWALDHRPPVRLAYRWLHEDGSIHVAEGLRSPFPRRVNPGDRVLTPITVAAPEGAGKYLLEVDVVHEGVRWFGCELRVEVLVVEPSGLPPARPELAASALTPQRPQTNAD